LSWLISSCLSMSSHFFQKSIGWVQLATPDVNSTAITADASGKKLSELRYMARGESRFSYGTTPTNRHTKLRFGDFDLIFTKSCISTH
jgi:hypothetical protein